MSATETEAIGQRLCSSCGQQPTSNILCDRCFTRLADNAEHFYERYRQEGGRMVPVTGAGEA